MKNLAKIALVILTFPFLMSCDLRAENSAVPGPAVGLCIVPFDVSTSAPMNKENFSYSCADIGTISIQDGRYLEILSMIKRSRPGPFLDVGIRVRMTLPDFAEIYIDDAGGVLIGASSVKLSKSDFWEAKKILSKIARKKGISIFG